MDGGWHLINKSIFYVKLIKTLIIERKKYDAPENKGAHRSPHRNG